MRAFMLRLTPAGTLRWRAGNIAQARDPYFRRPSARRRAPARRPPSPTPGFLQFGKEGVQFIEQFLRADFIIRRFADAGEMVAIAAAAG